MENCFRNGDIVIDYNAYTRRYTIKHGGRWVSVSPSVLQIWFSMMKENDETYQRVSISQDRSQLLITKLYGNFNFEFTSGNVTNTLTVTSATAKILLGNREKIVDKSIRVDTKMEKLEKRIVQRSKQIKSVESSSGKNDHELIDVVKSIKRIKKADGIMEMNDSAHGCGNQQICDLNSEDIIM